MVRCRVAPFLSFFLLLLFVSPAFLVGQAQAQTPTIFYTDINSGPNSGGENSRGAFVTLYGNNFGTTRGTSTVTVGGGAVTSYPIWTNSKITVQLGSAARTGNILVKVNGTVSNPAPFTVRSGRIFFVSTSGRDSNSGYYSSPWATLTKARSTASGGDIIYVMNGVQQTGADLSSASLTFSKGGTSSSPIAFVAYPNATVTIGSETGQTYGIRTAPNTSAKWIVIAGMRIRGAMRAIDTASGYNWRIVANDISCPNGFGAGGCIYGSNAGGTKIYGNNVHDTGSTSSTDISQYAAVNFDNTNSLDIGWNEIGNTRGCEAVKVRSTSSLNYGLKIHDNFIHDVRCSAVTLGNMDTVKGAVKVYNNLIVRAGTGPDPGGVQSEAYAGVFVAESANGVSVANNTFYGCGARKSGRFGCTVSNSAVNLQNNIFRVFPGEWYVGVGTVTPSGSNNLCYGIDSCPSALTASVSSDPQFINPAGNDFRLSATSPAIDKGISTGITRDLSGAIRPEGGAYDIGAYEFASGGTLPAPSLALTTNPTSFAFGAITVGQSSTRTGTVTNSSTSQSLTLSQANVTGTGFSVNGLTLPATIAPGESLSYSVRYAPTTATSVSGSISFVSNATNSPTTVSLSGTGVAAAVGTLAANPTSISFGSVTTGTNTTRTVTISNSGAANLTISSAVVAGSTFTISGITAPLTLAPGQTATLSVRFAPTSATSYSGTVTLGSNASNPTLNIALSGSGSTASVVRYVDLKWTASTSTGVSGYNVYRSTTSGGPYSKINSSLVTGTAYTNAGVSPGETYYYVVRAVSSTGLESANSSQVTAAIP